jgi:calcium-dependent protein kinase
LRTFKIGKKLQEAAIQFMVKNLASSEELRELQISFDTLDTSGDGKIGMEELIVAFGAFSADAKKEVQEIFDEVDLDKNGEIEFSEWVVASIDKTRLLTDEKLRLAFGLFDKDGGGSISPEEIKATLVGDGGG